MEQKSSMGKISLGMETRNSLQQKDKHLMIGPEYENTAESEKRDRKTLTFYKMKGNEDRFSSPCLVGGLYAYDGEINLSYEKNLLSNEYAVKMCLDIEEKDGEKLIKKEMIVSLKGELYFVKFILNPEEDDTEPCVIFGRSFLKLTKGVVDFGEGIIKIHPDHELFDDIPDYDITDYEPLFDFEKDLEDIIEQRPYTCKMGKSLRNKKRVCQDEGPSGIYGNPMTQEEIIRQDLLMKISKNFEKLKKKEPVLDVLSDGDKYRKIIEEISRDSLKLEVEERGRNEADKILGKMIKEKEDPGIFTIPIRLDGKHDLSALIDTATDINMIPYPVYQKLGMGHVEKIDWDTTISHEEAEGIGIIKEMMCQIGFTTVLAQFYIIDYPFNPHTEIVVGRKLLRTLGGNLCAKEGKTKFEDGQCFRNIKVEEETIETLDAQTSRASYPFNYCIKTGEDMQKQAHVNPLKDTLFWEKAVRLLGALPTDLIWKPHLEGCYSNEDQATGNWQTQITLTDPYGNIYVQSFRTKETKRKLSRYQKLSDIMSPNYTPM